YRERVLDPLAYFALLLLYVRDRRGWTYILAALVAAGALVGVIGLGQLALHRDLSAVPGTSIERVQALYGSPDNLGLLLDRVVPFWFAVALVARFGRQFRLLWWAVGVVLVIVLLLTFSVGAWIAVALSCLLVLALARPWGRWVAVACILVVAAGIGVKSHSVARAFNSGHANSTQTRLWVWQSSLHMLHDRPVLGIGPDNFQRYYAPTRRQDRWQRVCVPGRGYMEPGAGAEPCLSHPHDEFLDFWLSAGVLGLVSYLWLLYVFWNVAIRLGSRARFRDDRAAILGTMAAMAASVIHGLIDNSYFLVDLSLLFWLLCAFFSWMWTDGQAADEWPAPVEMRLDRDENARTTALTRAFRHFPVRRFAYRAERRRLEAVP
ncbi:MAG TPA: O-antigen ligase family protein, partial [Chloroflexota bacterium]